MLKSSLLLAAALAWAAPLAASAPSKSHAHGSASAKAKCPKAHAKAKQPKVAKPGIPRARAAAPSLSVPPEGSIFSLGRGSLFAP